MTLVSFKQLMAEAERGCYAVGYFESWNLESLLAVADAAEAVRSPVILGFSGIRLPDRERRAGDRLSTYAAMGLDTCRQLNVPACLLFNESPYATWVSAAIELGFGLVMFSDEDLSYEAQVAQVSRVVGEAHARGVAVEAEPVSLPGVMSGLTEQPEDLRLTDPATAADFVRRTGVDALAVNVGQVHLHGRSQVGLNLERLADLRAALEVPLVLHGATSVRRADLAEAVSQGVRKVNVGSVLKQAYFQALRQACERTGVIYNPYEVLGSGLASDVEMTARLAMQHVVEDLMRVFGSAGKG